MVRAFLTLCILFCCVGCGSERIPDGKSSSQLATEVAQVSESIRQTVESDWTVTPVPTLEATFTSTPTAEPTATETPVPTDTPVPTAPREAVHFATRTPQPGVPTQDGRLPAKQWRDWPVLPLISDNAVDLFNFGVTELGTDPHRLSVIGDCHSEPNVFLGIYDTDYYDLSDKNMYMKAAIDWFKGSFGDKKASVHSGLSVSSVLTSTWADPELCNEGESVLECEIRIHNPSVMFVNLGSNWILGVEADVYYDYLAEIVQVLCDHGILPILSTKADNVEGDWSINEITVQVARDYNVPLFNFWAIAKTLPHNGLDSKADNVHLSVEAWNWRNFYALKTLYYLGQRLSLFN